jgi:hypothetical protein
MNSGEIILGVEITPQLNDDLLAIAISETPPHKKREIDNYVWYWAKMNRLTIATVDPIDCSESTFKSIIGYSLGQLGNSNYTEVISIEMLESKVFLLKQHLHNEYIKVKLFFIP